MCSMMGSSRGQRLLCWAPDLMKIRQAAVLVAQEHVRVVVVFRHVQLLGSVYRSHPSHPHHLLTAVEIIWSWNYTTEYTHR
jgi:hypothetical protein